MSNRAILINLPEEVIEQFQEFATAGNRTIDEVIAQTLMTYPPNADYHRLLETLAYYKDEHLWLVVYMRLTPEQQQHLDRLNDKLEDSEVLSKDEQTEMKQLTGIIEHQMRLRSRALALLNERGFDTQAYLNTPETDEV